VRGEAWPAAHQSGSRTSGPVAFPATGLGLLVVQLEGTGVGEGGDAASGPGKTLRT
jgi:hypothetical protein